ncbi:hypothetical protein GCM10010129_81780 [Streptomyces fumigatiscleroticus]|nr:hypothetical protein GCM10010129_81780 [Streptomyces fumigatiscleroticus]
MGVCAQLVIRDVPDAEDRTAVLRLFGELHRDTVQDLCSRVTAALSGGGRRSVVIDVSSLTKCDTASLFTLLGIHQALQSIGGSLRLVTDGRLSHHAIRPPGTVPAPAGQRNSNNTPGRPGPHGPAAPESPE